jgi:hypothetical protein
METWDADAGCRGNDARGPSTRARSWNWGDTRTSADGYGDGFGQGGAGPGMMGMGMAGDFGIQVRLSQDLPSYIFPTWNM